MDDVSNIWLCHLISYIKLNKTKCNNAVSITITKIAKEVNVF